jgi:hypothetical protein
MKNSLILSLVICIAIFSGFVIINRAFSTTYVGGDYRGFTTIEEMAEFVDFVAVVKIKKAHPSFFRTENEIKDKKFIETDSEAIVEKLSKGSVKAKEIITIKQDGGVVDGKTQIWDGTTYVEENKKYLVFLIHLPNGKYAAVNPTQGILPITNKDTVIFSGEEYNISDILINEK